MTTLLIASANAIEYEKLISLEAKVNISIQTYSNNLDDIVNGENVDVILGDPDLCVNALLQCPNVKWVQSTWAGIKPLLASSRKDFQLTGVKGVFGAQMREYVFAYLLYFSRQIQPFINKQSQQNWAPIKCESLQGKTIGVLGMGSIGREVAKSAKHFGMNVIGVAQNIQQLEYVDHFYQFEQFANFAQTIDYLIVLLPHTEHTENLIDKHFLAALKPECIIINAGRGQVIVESALIDALKNNKLKSAVLDVFTTEPLPKNHPFWRLENLYITQHTAAISKPLAISKIFLRNLDLFMKNEQLEHLVDWKKGY